MRLSSRILVFLPDCLALWKTRSSRWQWQPTLATLPTDSNLGQPLLFKKGDQLDKYEENLTAASLPEYDWRYSMNPSITLSGI